MTVEARFAALMRQASMTTADYLGSAIDAIDGQFGEGYAEKHPVLVAAFIRTAAQDFHTAILAKACDDAETLIQSLHRIADALTNNRP